jgi:MYXO-CTERM domain-containing protein
MKFSVTLLGSLLLFGANARNATAHINLDYPTSNTTDQKSPSPCGARGAGTPTTLKPGETIVVKWTETISHPGHFRIAFDTDGTDDLKDPTSFTDIKNPAVAPILADGLHQHPSGASNKKWEASVTLPNVTCTKCTLQVIQVMTDKPPFGPGGGNDFYYRCADIVLAGAASGGDAGAPDVKPPADAQGGTGGAGGAGGGTPGAGGSPASGGSGGGPAGGSPGSGGSPSGSAGSGGGSGGSSARGGAAGSGTTTPSSSDDSGGCSMTGNGGAGSPPAWIILGLVAGLALRSRRRRV